MQRKPTPNQGPSRSEGIVVVARPARTHCPRSEGPNARVADDGRPPLSRDPNPGLRALSRTRTRKGSRRLAGCGRYARGVTNPPERAPHLRWRLVLLVALGGAIGTGIRAVLAETIPAVNGVSWSILGINVVGAFCLGLLLESLAMRGPDVGGRRLVRLFVGTGVLGGFTTYSTLAVDTAALLDGGRAATGTWYALLTVVAGLAAVVLGLLVASANRRPMTELTAEEADT